MKFFYSDDDNKLSGEILDLMKQAGVIALNNEFGKELEELGYEVSGLPIGISLSIVSLEEIRAANAEFRGIDKATDVLSFPQFSDRKDVCEELMSIAECVADGDGCKETLLGDVVICYDRAAEQAEEYGTGLKRELVYLFVHSILHLLGYDHVEKDEKKVMRAREEDVMEVIGL